MSFNSSHELTIGTTAVTDGPAFGAARIEPKSQRVWYTAHGISAGTSIVTHSAILCVLAAIVIAARPTEIVSPLNAIFAVEEADGGGLDFGNAEVEIELPNESVSPMPDMAVSAELPVTVLPESSVAMASLPSVQSPASESTGGAKRGRGSSKRTKGSGGGAEKSDQKDKGNVSFFGKDVQANTVAFVIDASKSMSGTRFQRAKLELVNAIELIEASQRNLGRVFNWIDQSQVQGGTQPQVAIAMTLKLKPDVVFFLSDGDIPFETQGIVKYNNVSSAVHTITFGSDVGAEIMRQIALRNDGEYRFIPDGF